MRMFIDRAPFHSTLKAYAITKTQIFSRIANMAAFKYILLVAALLGAVSASRLELNDFSEVSLGNPYLAFKLDKSSATHRSSYCWEAGVFRGQQASDLSRMP